jgi:hypothetical protein
MCDGICNDFYVQMVSAKDAGNHGACGRGHSTDFDLVYFDLINKEN